MKVPDIPMFRPGDHVIVKGDTEDGKFIGGMRGRVIAIKPDDPDGPWGPFIVTVEVADLGLVLGFSQNELTRDTAREADYEPGPGGPTEARNRRAFGDAIEEDLRRITR
jgi:hypothetical protein